MIKLNKITYEVWVEGHRSNGDRSTAQYWGSYTASSFEEAVAMAVATTKDPSYFDPARLTYWGCKFYPTEAQAREHFG